jgi:magnesium transporter
LSDQELAEIIQELEYEDQKIIIGEIGVAKSAQILAEMSSDDDADLIGELPERDKQEFFLILDDKETAAIKVLLEYLENTCFLQVKIPHFCKNFPPGIGGEFYSK